MKGAIFFSGQYGSTAQYARWISEATALPIFDVKDANADPSQFDFLVLGSSVIIYKLTIVKWVEKYLPVLLAKPVLLFTVSGAPPGEKLDGWIAKSLPHSLVAHMEHVGLRGRLNLKEMNWWTRLILKIGAWSNKDPQAKKEELEGFDYMDEAGIDPIVSRVRELTDAQA